MIHTRIKRADMPVKTEEPTLPDGFNAPTQIDQTYMRYDYCRDVLSREESGDPKGLSGHELSRLKALHKQICGIRGTTPMWHECRTELISMKRPEALFDWVKRWWFQLVEWGIIEAWLIEEYKEEFNARNIYANVESVTAGCYLLLDRGEANSYGSARVAVTGNGYLAAFGHSEVYAMGDARVDAVDESVVTALKGRYVTVHHNAKVSAGGQAYVESWYGAEVTLTGRAVARLRGPGEDRLLVPEGMTVERFKTK